MKESFGFLYFCIKYYNTTQKAMKHKVKVTVLDTKLYPEYQQQYCANPCSGNVRYITKETSLFSTAMMTVTTTGTAV